MICEREGCANDVRWHGRPGRPRYCSRRCAAIVNAAKRGRAFFVAIGTAGRAAIRAKGYACEPRPAEVSLMAAGRYREAAVLIYERAYSAGWTARHLGHRQLPGRRIA